MIGSSPLRKQAEAVQLVLRPRADVRGRDVADVRHVEAEQRPQLRLARAARRCARGAPDAGGRSARAPPSRRPSSRTCGVPCCKRLQGVPCASTPAELDTAAESVQTFAANGLRPELQDARLGGDGPDGIRARDPAARGGLRPCRLQPHASEGRAARGARRDGRRFACRPRRPRDRVHHGGRPSGLQGGGHGGERAALEAGRRPGRDRRLLHGVAGRLGGGPGRHR